MGGNAAIADAHNLVWKLRWVLSSEAGPDLLRTYEAERGPMGTFLMRESVNLMQGDESIDFLTAQLALGYPAGDSSALLGSGDKVTVADPHNTAPLIGARLPHSWLADGRSTVDLTTIASFAAVGTNHLPDAHLPVSYTCVPDLPDAGDPEKIWLIWPDGHVAAHVLPDKITAARDRVLSRARADAA